MPVRGERSHRMIGELPVARLTGDAKAEETVIGLVPPIGEGGIDTEGLDLSAETLAKLLEVEHEGWASQLPQMKEHYATFGDKLPAELAEQLRALEQRLDV